MARYYYCKDGTNVEGPIDEADLRRMFGSHILKADTQVCLEGSDTWESIVDIPTGFSQPPDPLPPPRQVTPLHSSPTTSPSTPKKPELGCCGGVAAGLVGSIIFVVINPHASFTVCAGFGLVLALIIVIVSAISKRR